MGSFFGTPVGGRFACILFMSVHHNKLILVDMMLLLKFMDEDPNCRNILESLPSELSFTKLFIFDKRKIFFLNWLNVP